MSICDHYKEMNQTNVHQQGRWDEMLSEKKERVFLDTDENFHWNRICVADNFSLIRQFA